VSLPADDTNLETDYSGQDLTDVSTKNDIRVSQSALGEFAIHQFKDFVTPNTCQLECELQSSLAPSVSGVFLQIYNRDTTTWDNVDSNDFTDADTDFTLSGNIGDLTNYKDGSGIISCRVYQEAI